MILIIHLLWYYSSRPNKRDLKDLMQWTKSVQWVRLEVLKTEEGQRTIRKELLNLEPTFSVMEN